MKTKDGQGEDIADIADYYVQDRRGLVGNCVSWWRANGQGYACDLRDAGVYKGSEVRSMRETDVPWLVSYVESLVVHHVRGDTQALERKDLTPREQRSRRAR